jgi:acetyl esterase/lipase
MPLDDPTLSPINASMAGLTPVHLNVGARDLFLSDIRRLRDALHKRRRHRHLHRAVGRQAHLLAANPHRRSPVDHRHAALAGLLRDVEQ